MRLGLLSRAQNFGGGVMLHIPSSQELVESSTDIYVKKGNTLASIDSNSNASCMPISGGTFTGGYFGTPVALTGTDIDVSLGSAFTKTITADATFTISGVPSGTAACFSLILTNGGAYTITWPSSVLWSEGEVPCLSMTVDVLTFLTADGGTTWYGSVSVLGAE